MLSEEWELWKLRVSEIRVKRIRVNQGLGVEWKQEIVQNGSLDKMNSVIISAIYHGISCLESRLNKHFQAILPATKNIYLKPPIWRNLQGATIWDQNL